MPETTNVLATLSESTAQLIEGTARSVVAVHSGGRWPASGIHWRSGIVVTAEEVLERDENIKLTLPGGRLVEASLAGRDPTTDVAVPALQPDGLPVAATTNAAPRAGDVVLAVGDHEGHRLRRAAASSPWQAGLGTALAAAPSTTSFALISPWAPVGEGGALVGAHGQVMAMTVIGPRHRADCHSGVDDRARSRPASARGQVLRGYLGAGLRPLGANVHRRLWRRSGDGVAFSSSASIRTDRLVAPACCSATLSLPGTANRSIVFARSCTCSAPRASGRPSISA